MYLVTGSIQHHPKGSGPGYQDHCPGSLQYRPQVERTFESKPIHAPLQDHSPGQMDRPGISSGSCTWSPVQFKIILKVPGPGNQYRCPGSYTKSLLIVSLRSMHACRIIHQVSGPARDQLRIIYLVTGSAPDHAEGIRTRISGPVPWIIAIQATG